MSSLHVKGAETIEITESAHTYEIWRVGESQSRRSRSLDAEKAEIAGSFQEQPKKNDSQVFW